MITVTTRVMFLLLSLALFESKICVANFTINPWTQVITLKQFAIFSCQHENADSISWRFNGTFLSRHQPLGVVSYSNGLLSILNVTGRVQYNETAIECVAVFYDLDSDIQISSSAYLYIQGILGAVGDLSLSRTNLSLLIAWTAPFTLNLTAVEPDISYCIQICNSSLEEYCYLSVCHIRDTNFIYALQHKDSCIHGIIYITVTPVNAAGKGHSKQVHYQISSDISVVAQCHNLNAERMHVMLSIKPVSCLDTCCPLINYIHNIMNCKIRQESHICRCELLLWNKAARYTFNSTNGLNCSSSNLTLEFSTEILPLNNHYNGKVFILKDSIDVLISTHDIQNVVVSDLKNNSLKFMVSYIDNTKAKGALISLIPVQGKNVEYMQVTRYKSLTIPIEKQNTTIFEVTSGIYKVLVYDIEHNGLLVLPTAVPAITSMVSVTGPLLGGIDVNCKMMNIETRISFPLLHINCSFNERFPSQWQGCMAALQSDEYADKLSITFQQKKSSVPLVYLIESERSYTITVFAMRENSIINSCNSKLEVYVDPNTSENFGVDTYRIVSGIALSVGAVVITVLTMVLAIRKVKPKFTGCGGLWNLARKASNPEIKMQECEAYETVQIRRFPHIN